MKIVEIGTFDSHGCPTHWHIAPDRTENEVTPEYCLEKRDEKV